MDTKKYEDNKFNLLKLWHNVKRKIKRSENPRNKINSNDFRNSILNKSSGNIFNYNLHNKNKMKFSNSFNIERKDFYKDYTIVT